MTIDDVGFFSYIYSSWITKCLWTAYRKGITLSGVPAISPFDSGACNIQKFENLWNEELRHKGPTSASLSFVAWRFVQFRVLTACILNASSQIVNFVVQTLLLRKLLEYNESNINNFFWGMHWVIYIIGFDFVQMILYNWSDIMNKRTAIRLKSACLSLLFKRIVNSNNAIHKDTSELMNILTKESHKIYEAVNSGISIICAPVVALCALICVSTWLSSSALIGLLVFILFYVLQYWIVNLITYCRKNANDVAEMRINRTNEVMSNIKMIKINGWEQHFVQNISNIRNRESEWLWKLLYIKSLNHATAEALPVIAIIVTFLMHSTSSQTLTASLVFPVCVSIVVQLHGSFRKLKKSLSILKDSRELFTKIKGGFLMEDTGFLATKPYEASQAVAIVNGTFVYDIFERESHEINKEKNYINDKAVSDAEKEKLKPSTLEPKRVEILLNVTFKARKSQLIGIAGRTGSGKSSLLLAALGQIKMTSGQLMRQGSCAYVGQKAWLSNGTIRENILFDEVYDPKRYYEAQVVCQLRQDLKNLPEGDDTEIGDDGVEVSEIIKQKVALARAFYADRDIYFLDDPLLSMEVKVKDEIFEDLIIGALAEKTIILVTDEIEYLDRCDYMYIMRDGKIVEHGTHKELMRLGKEYASMVKTAFDDEDYEEYSDEADDGLPMNRSTIKEIKPDEKINHHSNSHATKCNDMNITDNTTNKTEVEDHSAHTRLFNSYFVICSVILAYLLYAGVQVFSFIRLNIWIQDTNRNSSNATSDWSDRFSFDRTWYGISLVLVILGCLVQSLAVQYAASGVANRLHDALLNKLMQSCTRFFDVSSERIRNIFNNDLNDVSIVLPLKLDYTLRYAAMGFLTFFVLINTIPWFNNYVVLISILFYFLVNIYRVSQKNLADIEVLVKGRVDQFLQNSIRGLSTIRIFKKENNLLSKFQDLLDQSSACCFLKGVSERWLVVRLHVVIMTCVFVATSLVVIIKDQIPPAVAGLTLVYVFQLPSIILMGINYFSKMRATFKGVQEIRDSFQGFRNEDDENMISVVPDTEWPSKGSIEYDNVTMKYSSEMQPCLYNVTLKIDDGEKIGVFNTTEMENNSLVTALYRLYKLEHGRICIDGVDISKISLKSLRSKISIIPERPVFYNTIRFFLDPGKRHIDAELWYALEKAHLKDRVASIPLQLHYTIDESAFTQGEKQLLFLAKAILSSNKIIIIEENQRDYPGTSLTLQTIEKECPDRTILLIAHRLRSVLSCDRVLIMDDKQVLEFERPSRLLADQNSHFKKLVAKDDEIRNRI